ncbi:MAG: glycerophosphodiester phosphodiesterase [Candidatus Brocadiae bacterium]|nr:glycerophosphodiester phosphodiesterase [Candidatus Brocadiia bacterium]
MPAALCIAHRGFSATAPENTAVAVRKGMAAGADGCEFDVRLSRDGVVVLMHDATVDRTTNATGKVCEHTAAELGRLDAGAWKDEAFAGEPVPRLRDVLAVMRGTGCLAVVEIKESAIAEPVVAAVREAGMLEATVVIAFEEQVLADAARIEPALRRGLLLGSDDAGPDAASLAARAARCGAHLVDLHAPMLSAELVAGLHERGCDAWCWTVNEREEMAKLAAWGVDAITTDHPDVMLAWRQSSAAG